MKARNIGIKVEVPKEKCNDINCPFHGKLTLRGRTFNGTIIKANMHKTITMQWDRLFYIPKYERYEKRISRLKAHVPECIKVNVGDKIKVMETRPISKTKKFVIIEVLK